MKFYLKIYKKNTKFLVLTSLGGFISLIGYLIYILNPLQAIVDKFLTLQPGSFLFNLWSDPPYEVVAKIYIFNVTNQEEFLSGKEKLNFTEAGPFVYQEILRNTEAVFNDNGTLTFKPTRELVFREEYSVGNPDVDTIITPNIPLLGISSYVKDKYGILMNLGYSSVVNMGDNPSMKNLTVTEYLFGYDDPLVTLASRYVPSWIDFSKFGIIDRLMSLDNGNNTVTIHLENTTDEDPLQYSINQFNGSPGLKQWGYDEDGENSVCNTVEGSFDGGLFPRFLQENTTIRLYRRAFCRSVSMKYEATNYTSSGLKYYSYKIDQNFLATSEENPENQCFCKDSNCVPKGFGAIAPCYYGIPITMSQPHYLNADPEVLTQVNGLKPNKEKHDTEMKLSPEFGIPVSAQLRIQINLRVSPNQIVSSAKPFEGMMIPLFWVELGMYEIPSKLKLLLDIASLVPTIETILALLFALIGASLIAIVVLWVFFISSRNRIETEDPFGNRVEYSPILVLPVQHHIVSRELKVMR